MQPISENVINLIKETQISRIMLPKKYGGPQVDLKTFAKLYVPFLTIIFQQVG